MDDLRGREVVVARPRRHLHVGHAVAAAVLECVVLMLVVHDGTGGELPFVVELEGGGGSTSVRLVSREPVWNDPSRGRRTLHRLQGRH